MRPSASLLPSALPARHSRLALAAAGVAGTLALVGVVASAALAGSSSSERPSPRTSQPTAKSAVTPPTRVLPDLAATMRRAAQPASPTPSAPTPTAKAAQATPERASRSQPRAPLTRAAATAASFSGMASWYGGYFDGRRTASGAVYDQDGLSAASRTLPLGTVLRVCRAGTCVQVVVNDRGPYVGDRILDLSRGAARQLGMLSAGVAYVTATPVGRV